VGCVRAKVLPVVSLKKGKPGENSFTKTDRLRETRQRWCVCQGGEGALMWHPTRDGRENYINAFSP